MDSDPSQSGYNPETTAPPKKRRARGRDRCQKNWAPDDKKLIQFMRTCPLLVDTAHFFEVSPETIEHYIKKRWGVSYNEFRSKHLADTRAVLVNTALEEALIKRNWRAIEKCLEYYCKWHRVLDLQTGGGDNTIRLRYSLDDEPALPASPVPIDVTPEPVE